jgi:hypothetical protein
LNFNYKRGAGRGRKGARGDPVRGKAFSAQGQDKALMVTLKIMAIVPFVMIMIATMFMFPINKIKCI